MKLINYNKIYVLCPANKKTGGTELLHQLAYKLKKLELYVQIAYVCKKNKLILHQDFKEYELNYINYLEVEDKQNNLMIFPEVNLLEIKKFKYIEKVMWWLSVDFFEIYCSPYKCLKKYNIVKMVSRIPQYLKNPKKNLKYIKYHLYQSYYAKDYLLKIRIPEKNIEYLSDYINDTYLNKEHEDAKMKKNIVLYNPKKGIKTTKKLIKLAPDINWIPIENMNNYEVCDILCNSKVYIDFGEHPGKDRIPREAAICGCCVITGKKGAAKFFEDLPIKNVYKFDEKNIDYMNVLECIRKCLKNYDNEIENFRNYRIKILEEKNIFNKDVENIFLP